MASHAECGIGGPPQPPLQTSRGCAGAIVDCHTGRNMVIAGCCATSRSDRQRYRGRGSASMGVPSWTPITGPTSEATWPKVVAGSDPLIGRGSTWAMACRHCLAQISAMAREAVTATFSNSRPQDDKDKVDVGAIRRYGTLSDAIHSFSLASGSGAATLSASYRHSGPEVHSRQ